jgi:hypothetical protein
MINILSCNKKVKRYVLKDLYGEPYKFYRGGYYTDISIGRYFCSCFDIAKSYGEPIFETEIIVKKPLIIDATLKDGHSYYEHICFDECIISPETKRKDLVNYIKKIGAHNSLSTDEILEWAKSTPDIDSVIVKNVREGINSDFPIYDIMVWDESALLNVQDVTNQEPLFAKFQENTLKRVDLSSYIEEFEKDGISNITKRKNYHIEHLMYKNNSGWHLSHNLIVYTTIPVEICDSSRNYMTAEKKNKGEYLWSPLGCYEKIFMPENGFVRITNVPDVFAYSEYIIAGRK